MVTVKTSLEGYGPITATATVSRNPYMHEDGEPRWLVLNLTVKNALGIEITTDLEDYEQQQIEDELINEYCDQEAAYQDTLIDEAIERGRALAQNAYA
ncbi:MAG: hypothetical protein LCH81_03540 [Bacteroidetes bacterium]|nr:hypothetical protein [Bacteroidota bacterium]